MPTYEGDPAFWSHTCSSPVAGLPDSYGITVVTLGSHTGTHVDAPRHFVPDGASVTDLDLGILCGPCRVVQVPTDRLAIDADTLRAADVAGVQRLLLKTGNGLLLDGPFTAAYAHLTADAAHYLRRETMVRLIGIDYLSVESGSAPGYPVHHALLDGADPIVIVEAIDLRNVQPGTYDLYCLPLPLRGCDAAPVRAILVSSGD